MAAEQASEMQPSWPEDQRLERRTHWSCSVLHQAPRPSNTDFSSKGCLHRMATADPVSHNERKDQNPSEDG